MSVFKLQEWWSVKVADSEEFDHGCMIVGNIDNSSPAADKIAVGSFQGMFRMYQPTKAQYRIEDLVLEESLGLPILQLLLGKFIPSTDILGVAVLHPRKLVVYEIIPQGVKENRANYYTMRRAYHHDLGIDGKHFTAYNMSSGPFGGVRGRDMFVVQSLDGKLMILEQSAHAFSRQLADCLLPGPIVYIPKTDSFVTVNYACTAECYRYQVLASSQTEIGAKEDSKSSNRIGFGLTSIRSAMNEWSLKIGESCRQIVEGNFVASGNSSEGNSRSSSHSSELLMVCNKSLFLLKSETGGLIQQKRLDRSDASCVCTYPTNSNAAPMNFILAGMDGTIQIYSAFNLIWAAKAATTPVQMSVNTFGAQQGLIVTLDDTGNLAISYLGTKPPISSVTAHVRDMNYDKVDEEHRALLQIIRDSQNENRVEPTERLVIRSQIAKTLDSDNISLNDLDLPVQSLVPCYAATSGLNHDHQYVKICVRLYLSFNGAQPATNVSLVVAAPTFAHAIPKNFLLQKVSGGKTTPVMVKLYLYATRTALPATLDATITATYTSSKGEPRVTTHVIALPMFLAIRPKAPVKSALCKVILDTEDHPAQALTELFADVLYASQQSGMDVSEVLGNSASQAMGLGLFAPVTNSSSSVGTTQQLSSIVSILVSKNAGRYRIQADSYPALCLVMVELERRLNLKLTAPPATTGTPSANASSDLPLTSVSLVKCADVLPLEEYFACIQTHFATRQRINVLNATLNDYAHQYRLIEKRLLVRFKDKNPTPLGGLDALLRETYNKIITVADSIQEQQSRLKSQSAELELFSRLIVTMAAMKYAMTRAERALLQSYLCPDVKDNSEQGWEETVNASIMYLLKTALAKNVKESVSLTGTTLEIGTSIDPLKKHLLLVVDRLEKGARISSASNGSATTQQQTTTSTATTEGANTYNSNSNKNPTNSSNGNNKHK